MKKEKEIKKTGTGLNPVQKLVMQRQDAITIFFKAIDQDDPYWDLLVDDWYDEKTDTEPSQWDVGRALGFTDNEMELAAGLPLGRLKELGV